MSQKWSNLGTRFVVRLLGAASSFWVMARRSFLAEINGEERI